MSDEKPRCRTCGFIGIKNRRADETNELDELTDAMRLSGYQSQSKYPYPPQCRWNVSDLEDEANQIIRQIDPKLSDSRDAKALKRILDAPRDKCVAEWIQYKPGRSPKQHEEIRMHDTIIQVQNRLSEINDRALKWHNEQADKDAAMTKQIAALSQVHHNENQTAVWIGIVIAALIGFASLIVSIVK